MAPKIAVCIPTFNRAHFLQEAIKSVLEQTFTDFEIYISDNDSLDNTAEIVNNFKDKRIYYHCHSKNIGLARNYQFVLTMPNTELVAYLSDDDLYTPEHLETAINALDLFPDAAYFANTSRYFGTLTEGYLRPATVTDTQTPLLYFSPKQAVNFLGIDNPGPMTVCRRKVLHSQLCWPQPDYLPSDLWLLTQLMAQGGFVFSNQATMLFRVHEENTSFLYQRRKRLRLNCMVWYGIRWLADFLIDSGINTIKDIENHGMQSPFLERHVVPLVLGLASYDSRPEFRKLAERIFAVRRDADLISSRFQLARRFGFWIIPVLEKMTQLRVGWYP